MAINFITDISEENLLFAYNNNVVRFRSTSTVFPQYCDITGLDLEIRLYPKPDGSFYFNFKEYFSAIVNTKNFVDDLTTDIVEDDLTSLSYDATDGRFLEGEITVTVVFPDASTDSASRNVKILAGVVQLEDHKKQQIPSSSVFAVLSPLQNRTNNQVYLKYWEGYPFDLAYYTADLESSISLFNVATGLSEDIDPKGSVTRLFLSDGRTDLTIEEFFPLVIGMNEIRLRNPEEELIGVINLVKEDVDCGVYIKWLNHLGGYNYWLFHRNSYRDRSSKYGEEVNTDFDNPGGTFAPTMQVGKTSSDLLKCNSGKLTENDRDLFVGLLESPKVYLFTGDRYSRAGLDSWIEVTLKTASLRVEDAKKKHYKYNIDIELPTRYAQFL